MPGLGPDTDWSAVGGPSLRPSALAIGDAGAFAATPVGLFSSDDGGGHWARVRTASLARAPVTALTAHGTTIVAATSAGVFVTHDGETWVGLGGPARASYVHEVEGTLFAGSPSGLMALGAGAWESVSGPKGVPFDKAVLVGGVLVANAPTAGLFRRDGGWVRPAGTEAWGYEGLVARGARVHASSLAGLFGSTDGGLTFTPLRGPGEALGTIAALAYAGERLVVASTQGVFREEGGELVQVDAVPASALAADGSRLLAAARRGVRRSTDGVTWTAAGSIDATSPDFVASVGDALLSSDAFGALRFVDGAFTDVKSEVGSRIAGVLVSGLDVWALAGSSGFGTAESLLRSRDGGQTFAKVGAPATDWSTNATVTALAVDGERVLVATSFRDDSSKGVFFSSDGGRSFLEWTAGLPASKYPTEPWLPATAAHLRGEEALVAVRGRGLYRHDAALGWQSVSAVRAQWIVDLRVGGRATVVAVARDGTLAWEDVGGVFHDGGTTFATPVRALTSHGDFLMVALDDGRVLGSADLGATWQPLGQPSSFPVRSLVVHGGRLIAATEGAALRALPLACP
ncbi:MAG: hypothetical protein IPJ34_37785 [Myxococcales bacterium]|nr:hypothetical protein [Myxococcales bacterium]